MNKVLIIAFYFPPIPAIGAQRPYRLAKYFPKFGWEPIVLTAKLPGKPPNGIRVFETEYIDIVHLIKSKFGFDDKGMHEALGIEVTKNFNYPTLKSKAIKLIKEIITYPDPQRYWCKYAYESASDLMRKEKIDLIISTSSPVTSHIIARKLKQKYKLPWVADLRDPWTQHHFYNKFMLLKYFERQLELKTLSRADVLVTVTKKFAENFKLYHKHKRIYCVTNGFDTDEFSKSHPKVTKKFTITYTGQLLNSRDPSLLFKVIKKLIEENLVKSDVIELRFFGHEKSWITKEVKKYNLDKNVNFYGLLPRELALEKQRESQLLLLLLDSNNKEDGVYPAKIFEYFGARRPIIAIGGSKSIVKDILSETNAGKFASNFESLKNIVIEYYQEFLQFGEVKSRINNNINYYTFNYLAKKYAEILNRIIKQ